MRKVFGVALLVLASAFSGGCYVMQDTAWTLVGVRGISDA